MLPDLTRWFRPARPASFARNYAKTLAQTTFFWGFFLVVLPWLVSEAEHRIGSPTFEPNRPVAAAIFVVFGSLGLTSGFTMSRAGEGTPLPIDAPRRLVVVGPYRYVRNPMAVAGLAQGGATGLWFGSPLVFVYVLAGGLLWNTAIRPPEEADLRRRFGAEFDHYCETVRCWLPTTTPYEPPPPASPP